MRTLNAFIRLVMNLSLLGVLLILLPEWASGWVMSSNATEQNKLYIVHLGALPTVSTTETIVDSHVQLLSYVKRSEDKVRRSLVLSYTKSFNGFAAMLSPREAEEIKQVPEVISVFPSQRKKLLTTRSWDFLGLTSTSRRNPAGESDIIVGVLDTGVWPESRMYDDTTVGRIPSGWKGGCQTGQKFTTKNCNRKLIGAKYFVKGFEAETPVDLSLDYLSPRDSNGHGSHTSSTAAGSVVKGASLYGLAQGAARGAVPGARIAMYKVCWTGVNGVSGSCSDADILAAFDEAIADGVDLISVSVGGGAEPGHVDSYVFDSIAIGAFHAMQNRIVVACAAGNGGPILNAAPWIITVGASTIDRQFYSPIVLGNNATIQGIAINTFKMNDSWHSLLTGENGDFTNSTADLSMCDTGDLDPEKVEGKIVYCEVGNSIDRPDVSVLQAHGAGLIYADGQDSSIGFLFVVPTSAVGQSDADTIAEYINGTSSPAAKILPCDVALNQTPAPLTAFFSSRGPNSLSPDIMKPDLLAPGVDILAAWPLNQTITELNGIDTRYSAFNIQTGTSMATPHVAGAAAYVKSFHPGWSPSAIKSALMTTANPLDRTNPFNTDLEFGYGAGNINPTKAIDPGLIYDADVLDYVLYLCSHGYNSTVLTLLTGNTSIECPSNTSTPYNLNYPAVTAAYRIDLKAAWYTPTRTLTYVGKPANATFTARLEVPEGMEVAISPETLSFAELGAKASFEIKMRARGLGPEAMFLSASLAWISEGYVVRSPLLAYLISTDG